ncbi:MAG: DUF4912 domain-containing protein [Candidatus Omnitrophica bacterium]|nr:DUF4912 domain-containing protein [Candidatus Omnitrophota bacterium]
MAPGNKKVTNSKTQDFSREEIKEGPKKQLPVRLKKKNKVLSMNTIKVVPKKKLIRIRGKILPKENNIQSPVESNQTVPGKVIDIVDHVRELPVRYNDTRLVVIVRDPQCCFTYWDVSDDDYSIHALSTKTLHLNIYRLSDPNIVVDKLKHIDIEVNSHCGSWYIMIGMPGRDFLGELGYYDDNGNFIILARSRVFHTPRNSISNAFDEEWMLSDEMAHALYGELELSGLSSASMINLFNKYIAGGESSHILSGPPSLGRIGG